jgi:hypothetical protein
MFGPLNPPRFNHLHTGKPGQLIIKLFLFNFLQLYVCGHAKLQPKVHHLHLLRPTCSERGWLPSRIPISLPELRKVATLKQHINPRQATAPTTQPLRSINASFGIFRQGILVSKPFKNEYSSPDKCKAFSTTDDCSNKSNSELIMNSHHSHCLWCELICDRRREEKRSRQKKELIAEQSVR